MDRLFRENGQPFVVHRDRERVGEIEGIKDQGTLILENPGVEVFVGDRLEDVRARAWLHVTDVTHNELTNHTIIQIQYETDQQLGSQQGFTFDQVIYDLGRKIEELGGEDKAELQEMIAEIRGVLESQDSISRSKFARWSALANKHFPWLTGPLGALLVNYTFAPPSAG
jgi:hypothetical protein